MSTAVIPTRVATPRAYGYFGLTAPADERRDSRLW